MINTIVKGLSLLPSKLYCYEFILIKIERECLMKNEVLNYKPIIDSYCFVKEDDEGLTFLIGIHI